MKPGDMYYLSKEKQNTRQAMENHSYFSDLPLSQEENGEIY
jgi:hypothetical protein